MASTSTGTATGSRRGAARRTCLGELQRTMGNILGLLVPSYARRRQGGSRLRAASAAEGAGDAGGGKDVYYSGSEFESGGYSSGSGSDGEAGGHGIGRLYGSSSSSSNGSSNGTNGNGNDSGGNGSNGGMGSDADSPLSGELGLAATARPRRSPRIRKRLNGSDPLNDSDSASTDSPADELHSSGKAKANGAGTSDRRKRRPRGSTDSSSTSTSGSPSLRRPLMPVERKKKTLVLDLDETLIHSTSRGSRRHDFMVEVLIDKHVCLYYVYKRPYADLFLRKAAEWFKIVIFTASMPEYADPVIDWLDANRTIISKRYFRQSCTPRNGTFMKNLEIVESDLSQVALVDNSPFSYALNQDNGIPIDTWIDDPNDEALLDLLPFLDALRFADDVRSVLSLRL